MADVIHTPNVTADTAEVPLAQPVEPDSSETDSALGEDSSTYTDSLRSSLLEALQENGRGYHKYKSEQGYIFPEDKGEQDRLDLQHALFLKSFGEKLNLAPIDKVQEVLDLGTGTGIWAIDFADQHPESQVVGIDLSPIQPNWVPPNCKFEVDDFDSEWTYKQKFDYIHGRMINTTSASFPKLFSRAFQQTKPGGWFEMQDIHLPMGCDDGTMGTQFQKWNDLFFESISKMGRDPSAPAKFKDQMIEAGFESVTEKIYKWPINTWAKDPAMKEIGAWNLINMLDGLEGFTYRLWTQVLGWTVEEVDVFLEGVRKDLRDRKSHCYFRIHVVYGQKPQ